MGRIFRENSQVGYKAVIFDLHYTIVRPFPSRGIFYQSVLKKYGFDLHPRMINRSFNETWKEYGNKKITRSSLRHYKRINIENWWFDFHYLVLKKLGLQDRKVARSINREISNQFYGNPRIHKMYSDAIKILPFLKKRKIKLALATNSYKSTKRIINYFRLNRYFDYITISCDIGISKPNPKLYLLIANKFSLKPSQILCVGDSYPTDIMGARKVGCGAAIIYRKKTKIKKKYDCIYLNNLRQIKNLLG